ncbi:SPL family radical SAM protein [Infirmifilum lucidum]|uniref:SPL family radical SAM protein n=1 Tax=Infirmifilum lucidum TaxID=2776706 RepID=UPI001C3FA978|nr:radical SAM protein [Infirmifilum lucidum]
MRYERVRVSHALSKSGLPDLDYAFNPYAGCSHGCIYCYARAFTRYPGVAENWGRVVFIKENVVEVLEQEVKRVRRGVVGVSTITDPYQPVEVKEELTRRGLEVLLENGFRVSVQTKSPLVTRDIDLLASHRPLVDVGLTITTLDYSVARLIEPSAPPPNARVEALRKLASAGLETWVFLGPIIRGLNDSKDSIARVVEVAFETGSKLYYDYYHHRPELEASMGRLLGRYPQALSASPGWRERVRATVEKLCRETGVTCAPAFPAAERSRSIAEFLGR